MVTTHHGAVVQSWCHYGNLLLLTLTLTAGIAEAGKEIVTNQWYVQLHDGHGLDGARHVAKRNGFSVVSSVGTQ